jgi:fatty acid desaturase
MQSLPIRSTPGHALAGVVHAALMAGALASWWAGWWPLTAAAWCAIAWMDHAALTRLHEAAHGMLFRWRWLNELQGVAIGTASLTPLSVYRYVHARHHAHLGRERDPEFWPYNLPWTPRWMRVFYAWSELAVGWLLTPVLYSIRTAASWKSVPRLQRKRLIAEWVLLIGAWGGLLVLIDAKGWWEAFLVAHLIPAWLAGTMQTIRKFTEHLGMFGEGIIAMTRTVAYRGPIGRAASASQLHVEHHATHHRYARIPYYVLPKATDVVYADALNGRLFSNHMRAFLDMVPHLFNPRVGPQWLKPVRVQGGR